MRLTPHPRPAHHGRMAKDWQRNQDGNLRLAGLLEFQVGVLPALAVLKLEWAPDAETLEARRTETLQLALDHGRCANLAAQLSAAATELARLARETRQ